MVREGSYVTTDTLKFQEVPMRGRASDGQDFCRKLETKRQVAKRTVAKRLAVVGTIAWLFSFTADVSSC